jgi:hypothetical protein
LVDDGAHPDLDRPERAGRLAGDRCCPARSRSPIRRSFFALGMFSGIASSCCAPVLAGVMTLSALSGSPVGGTLLGLSYVFGMTFPLFVMALVWDRFRLGERRWLKAKQVRLHVAGRVLATNTVNITVAVAFAVMGVFVIYLGNAGRMTGGPGFQVAIGRFLDRLFGRVEDWTSGVPEIVLGLIVLALAAVFVVATLRGRKHPVPAPGAAPEPPVVHACHDQPSA